MKARNSRQQLLRAIITHEPITTQKDLVQALRQHGLQVTQATVSRDMQELGVVKGPGGRYALEEDLRLKRLVVDFVQTVNVARNLLVVQCSPGTANSVAAVLDDAQWPHIVGTVSGDNTFLMVCDTDEAGATLCEALRELLVPDSYPAIPFRELEDIDETSLSELD